MEDPSEICHGFLRKEYKNIQKSVSSTITTNAKEMRDFVLLRGTNLWANSQLNNPTLNYNLMGNLQQRFKDSSLIVARSHDSKPNHLILQLKFRPKTICKHSSNIRSHPHFAKSTNTPAQVTMPHFKTHHLSNIQSMDAPSLEKKLLYDIPEDDVHKLGHFEYFYEHFFATATISFFAVGSHIFVNLLNDSKVLIKYFFSC
jgi:hypothetical protein